jgi:predicted phage terminase large subunit-like protein
MIKQEWFRYYEPYELPEEFQHIVQSWDTASKESELADYSVCTTWGIDGAKRYLLDVYRQKVDFPKLKRAVIELIGRYQPSMVLVEDKASGIQLIPELRAQDITCLKAIKPQGDKKMRMHAQTAQFEGGFVRFPKEAPWLASYEAELMTFPRARHDDQVDSTSQVLGWLAVEGVEPGIIAYYRALGEARGAGRITTRD